MDGGSDSSRARGLLLFGVGVAVELLGTVVLVWQEQNVYTINSSITLPTFGAMVAGIALVARGFSRLLRSASARSSFALAGAGAAVGGVVLVVALAWQLAYGLIPSGDLDLEVYATLALFFLGVAAVTTALRGLDRPESAVAEDLLLAPRSGAGSSALRFGSPVAVLAAGIAFLGASGTAAGWLNAQAADVNSLYQFVALELAGGGAWLLLAGTATLLDRLPSARQRVARRVVLTAGLGVLAIGVAVWWWSSPFVYALGETVLGGFLLAGVGLLRTGARTKPSRAIDRPRSYDRPAG